MVLSEITFAVQAGELFFVIGGSGCGKSTLLRHLVGLMKPARGTVRYSGEDFTAAGVMARRNLLKTFGVLYQSGALWSSMTLRENVALPLEQYTTLNRRERGEIVALKLAQARQLLVLADGGGSNGYRNHLWKFALQKRLVNPSGLAVTVAHFPTGASKWNPADHRLFSAISCNWAGEPLSSYDKMLGLLRGTTTEQGLVVHATLTHKTYATEIKISDEQMAALNLEGHELLPKWNYTIKPL